MKTLIRAATWNLHCQGAEACVPIPTWVVEEVADADVVIFTEAPRVGRRESFIAELEGTAGFCCVASENKGGNDVLIAVKKKHKIKETHWEPCFGCDYVPENLIIKAKIDGTIPLTIAGVRIKDVPSDTHATLRKENRVDIAQAEKRRAEFECLLDWCKGEMGTMLIGGDFNPYREYLPGAEVVKPWNSRVLQELAAKEGLELVCPALGSSIKDERSRVLFRHDRFLTTRGRLLVVGVPEYSRDFTERDKTVYTHGRNFRGNIKAGFPDHALLSAQFQLTNN